MIVEGVAANKAVAGQLGALLARVPSSTVAVFVEHEVDQRTVGFKVLKASDKVVKFESLAGAKLLAWVRAGATRLGGEMDAAAAREVVDLAGDDQWRLAEEIQKLVNFEPKVRVQAVRELVTPSVERSIFDLVEAMTSARSGQALAQYRGLLAQKQSEIYVLTMIQWQLREFAARQNRTGRPEPGGSCANGRHEPVCG